MEIHSKSTKQMVAAIDIGSTHSGYAFSVKNDWWKVYTSMWNGGSLVSSKAPTSLLLKDDFTESYFGYEAEDRYADLKSDDRHHNYYFFQRFKMIIHGESNAQHKRCYDITGKTLEAGQVFTHCIKCLKESMFRKVESVFEGIRDDDIEYVLTVPAFFGENSKMFLREASVNAGIKMENLTIALEPEAASIYCQYFEFAKEDTSSPALGVVKPGTKYMVVDLGGGTADITVHQKCEDNTLEEVLVSGGPWGGKAVDDQFIKFLSELVGRDVWDNFKMENMEEYLEITRSFEPEEAGLAVLKGAVFFGHIPDAISQRSAR